MAGTGDEHYPLHTPPLNLVKHAFSERLLSSESGHSFKWQNPAIHQAIMNPMQSHTTLILLSSLVLTVGHLTHVTAVTDAELEALEKQIEQLEVEEKEQAEAEAKRKVEQKRKAEAEAKRKAEVEAKKQAEEKRKQEAEEKRLAEEETKRKEEEVKKRAEEEKKEKYKLLIAEAGQAISNKDKELAISKYNEALTLTPGDPVANSGIKEAEKLKHKVCYEVLGVWHWKGEGGLGEMTLNEDGIAIGPFYNGTWECSDPKNRKIDIIFPGANHIATLSEDGKCLKARWFGEHCYLRPGDKSESDQQKESQTQPTPFGR